MAMRLTGIYSGLDTESIITELVAAKKTKVDSTKKAQTKLQWTQDKWKELNTKLLSLYTKTTGTMRFENAYAKKTTKVSNSAAVSVVTGEGAVNGVQSMRVDKLAKTAYLTGGAITKDADGNSIDVTSSTTMSELGINGSASFTMKVGGVEKTISVTADSKVSDVVSQLQSAGLNASFDTASKRLFISAKESGEANDFDITGGDSALLSALGLGNIKEYDGTANTDSSVATKIDGQDATILLNGATFTSNTNVFTINGLTYTCLAETTEDFTVTTQEDTDGIYDMVKNFIKEYNSIINELDSLYNADSAKGYEPLTDDEKEEMSESEIEKWEEKIKDSLLRGDSTVNSIASSLKQIMLSGVKVDGKQMYLSDFGISTLSYFTAADNEKHAYHIDGDADDSNTSGNADKLKSMIASDPDTVTNFFSALCKNLYAKMGELSKSVEGYSSFNSFYADKKMKEDYSNYTTKISDLEDKLQDYEDKWYEKFAAMETALSKLQSNSSAVTSLLGG